jgi:hypothetical protein
MWVTLTLTAAAGGGGGPATGPTSRRWARAPAGAGGRGAAALPSLLRPAAGTALQFPYYTFVDRSKMYTVGSLFYAIYFFASFPMFMRIDEHPGDRRWSLGQVGPEGVQGRAPSAAGRTVAAACTAAAGTLLCAAGMRSLVEVPSPACRPHHA